MLTAYRVRADGTKEKVVASENLPLWSELPEGENYICPFCGRTVILRKNFPDGCRVPHFAHKRGSCTYNLWEPESEEHLRLKRLVADVFSSFAQVDIEKHDGIFQGYYYPDVYVNIPNGLSVAVEVQCSRKSVKAIEEKTRWYTKHKIYTLWLWKWDDSRLLERELCCGRWKPTAQERLMVRWYGYVPFIDLDGWAHLVFPTHPDSREWWVEVVSFRFVADAVQQWFVPLRRGVWLYGPPWSVPWGVLFLLKEFLTSSPLQGFPQGESSACEILQNTPFSKRLSVWLKLTHDFLQGGRGFSLSDVQCLIDEGEHLREGLRRCMQLLESGCRNEGKYSRLIWEEFLRTVRLYRIVATTMQLLKQHI